MDLVVVIVVVVVAMVFFYFKCFLVRLNNFNIYLDQTYYSRNTGDIPG